MNMTNEINGRVLVVDDQPNWRKALTILLEAEGYVVDQAEGYESAKESLENGIYDLVILDVRLQDKDVFNVQGVELLEVARSRMSAIKTIVITGYPESLKTQPIADLVLLKVPPDSVFDALVFRQSVRHLLSHQRS